MLPTISVITACRNCAHTLEHAIASVASQNGVQPLHHVVDGGSTDGSLAIIQSSPKISNFLTEPDNGLYDAMNKGIRLAEGDVIGILNADDFYSSPLILQRVAQVFEDESVAACYGDLCYVSGEYSRKIVRYWRSGPYVYRKFYWGWMPPHPTFFVRRSIYERYGGFNLSLGSAADYELMLRFLLKYQIKTVYIPEVLVCMRIGGVSNASMANRIKANRMDRKAWLINGLRPYPWTLWCKPLRKLHQYFVRPSHVPIAISAAC